jgi:hypothetical protein
VLALILAAGSLGLDNFAASIAIGLSGVDHSLRIRIALIFGIFEAVMPAIRRAPGPPAVGAARKLGARDRRRRRAPHQPSLTLIRSG